MQQLDRTALTQAQFLQTITVPLPELDMELRLRELSATETAHFSALSDAMPEDAQKNMRVAALLICLAWVDDAGNRVLREDDIDLVLQRLPLRLLNLLSEQAARNSGLLPTAMDDAKKN